MATLLLQLLQKPSLHNSLFFSTNSYLPPQQKSFSTRASSSSSQNTTFTPPPPPPRSRRQLLAQTAALTATISSLVGIGGAHKAFAEESLSEWERVYLPIDPGVVLLDIAFVPGDPSHGFLLGTRQTILETKDGGNTWAPRSIPSAEEEDFNYRFNSISFRGNEGWIVGKPAILLYTSDAGENWKRIPLSSQLPGDIRLHGSGTGTIKKEERPRFFDSETKRLCWDKAEIAPGRHPDRWRKDSAGNIVLKRFHRCQGCLCYEFDHIKPFSRGGQSVVENCQILQTRVNRFKSDKEELKANQLKGYSCDINFSDNELDIIEIAVYGDVIRPGKECRCRTINEMLGRDISRDQMVYIKATGEKSAEMVTDEGAIYITANGGYNWRAAVQETVSATLNRTVSSGISGASYYTGTFSTVNRSPEGNYVAVSSRGNFYLTWEPGQPYWQPHNRNIARRIQSMGWRADGGLWLLVRGGGLYLSKDTGITEEFEEVPVQSRGFGILDVGYRSQDEAWAAGGSGILLKTTNSGKTWIRDKAADNIAANLYSVKFINDKQGFVLGNDGVLLKYLG